MDEIILQNYYRGRIPMYYDKYKVEHSTIEEVLNKNGVKNLHEYYNEIFNKE